VAAVQRIHGQVPIPEELRCSIIRMKVLLGFCRAGGNGARGCRAPPWRRRQGVSGDSLDRSWIGMMAASSTVLLCWEHHVWRHDLEVHVVLLR
jgi:hypothetical protein